MRSCATRWLANEAEAVRARRVNEAEFTVASNTSLARRADIAGATASAAQTTSNTGRGSFSAEMGTFGGISCLSIYQFFREFPTGEGWRGIYPCWCWRGAGGPMPASRRASNTQTADGTGVLPFPRSILMFILHYRAAFESYRNSAA